ncbi:MAG: NAD(P)H-binding protein [Candidatus Krumholzibacteriia bacterium]
MNIALRRAAIVGATGPTGRHLAHELQQRGVAVRAVSRAAANLERCFPDPAVERVAADALDAAAVARAVAGCDLVVDCIGLPPDRMADHAATARIVAAAAQETGARLLQVSSWWGFMPVRRLPLNESHPREGGNAYARARRAAEDVMLAAGAAVIHLPDFFGPHVHTSTLQMPLREAAAGKTMNWIGAADTEREYAFVPDAMAMAADLALRAEAYGRSWIFPGSGPLDARRTAEIASAQLDRRVKVRTAPRWLLRALGLVSADLRAFAPVLDDYLQPIRYDAGRLAGLLGPLPTTPYAEAIGAVLEDLRAGRGGQNATATDPTA